MRIHPTEDDRVRTVAGMWGRWETTPEFCGLKYDEYEAPESGVARVDISQHEIRALEGLIAKYAGRQRGYHSPAIEPYQSVSLNAKDAVWHAKKIARVLVACAERGYPRLGTVELSRATLIHEIILGNLRSRHRAALLSCGIRVSDQAIGARWWSIEGAIDIAPEAEEDEVVEVPADD